VDRWSFLRFESSPSLALAESPARTSAEVGQRTAGVRAERGPHPARERFASELAQHSDGIGGVHLWHCLAQRGVWSFLAEQGDAGTSLQLLARRFGANLAYLNVVFRTFALSGWLRWQPHSPVERSRVTLTDSGRQLLALSSCNEASAMIVSFLPVAQQMARYLFGTSSSPQGTLPELSELRERNAAGWELPVQGNNPVAERWRLALEGNLIGPVVVALKDEFYPGLLGAWLQRSPRAWEKRWIAAWARRRQRSQLLDAFSGTPPVLDLAQVAGNARRVRTAFELLRDVGWVELEGTQVELTAKGRYAAPRAWAYGVPVSYLPMFGQLDELLFGEHGRVLQQVPGGTELHVDRRINVKASGASHGRYFAAADEVVLYAFNRPFPEQPRGFADMGSGDGTWLQHVWELISTRTERGRLMREFPERSEYQPLMVGIDYNRAARRATRERLTRAGVPHLVLFGDINDPEGLRTRLAERGVDSGELLHGSSFLIHNRPYQPPRDAERAARRPVPASPGAYVADGLPIEAQDLQQNLVELFSAWGQIIGPHGMLVIELHDPERVVVGKTLTNYILTHGLSAQLTVGIAPFLAAAREAGLAADEAHQRLFPPVPELATVSVNHFRHPSWEKLSSREAEAEPPHGDQ
jgi:hypothetical protein